MFLLVCAQVPAMDHFSTGDFDGTGGPAAVFEDLLLDFHQAAEDD